MIAPLANNCLALECAELQQFLLDATSRPATSTSPSLCSDHRSLSRLYHQTVWPTNHTLQILHIAIIFSEIIGATHRGQAKTSFSKTNLFFELHQLHLFRECIGVMSSGLPDWSMTHQAVKLLPSSAMDVKPQSGAQDMKHGKGRKLAR